MTIQIVCNNVTAVSPLLPALPDVNQLVSAYFRADSATSINRVPGGAALSDIGTGPVYSAQYGTFTPFTAAVTTPVLPEHEGMTFMAIWRRVNTGSGAYWHLFSPNDTPDAHDYPLFRLAVSGTQLELKGTYPSTDTATLALSGDLDSFRFVAGTIGGGAATKIYNFTDDTASSDGGTGSLYVHSGDEYITLGCGEAGGPTRVSDFVWAGIVAEAMSEADIGKFYLYHKYLIGELSAGTIII